MNPRMLRVRIYDNGGATADRYTIVPISRDFLERSGLRMMLGCSSNCDQPNGISQWSNGQEGPHLGKRITWRDLLLNVRAHLAARLTED